MNEVRHPARRRHVGAAALSVVETLEGRQLLASVGAGEIGVFQGPNGQPVRINVTGTAGNLDFVGAHRDELGTAQLNDIPMTVFDAQTGRVISENLGGYAGRKGIKLADQVLNDDVGDSVFRGTDPPYATAPNGRVNLDGLAANNLGRTYGVNRFLAGPGQAEVDILRVDSKMGAVTLDADVTQPVLDQLQAINPDIDAGDLLSVIGADFPPDDANLLYFAMNINYPTSSGGPNPTLTRKPVPAMFTYNLTTHAVTLDPTLFGFNGPDDTIRIDDFTFMDDGRIAMFGSVQTGQGGQPQVGLFFSDADAVVPDDLTLVRIGEQLPGQAPIAPTTSLAAIEAIPGENYLIAVTIADPTGGGDAAQLVRIDLASGRGHVIGPVVDPDENPDNVSRLGENIRDLTWNSRVYDHYFQPGKRGVLLGAESTKDVLVALDARDRFPNSDLFAVYGNNVSSDMSVAISNFTLDSDTDLSFNTRLYRGISNPYGGSAGVVRTNMTGGNPINLALANGGVYIGLRTRDITNAISVPVLSLSSRTDLAGSKPSFSLPRTVVPGVFINGSMKNVFIAGTISGEVNVNGSLDTMYAGNVLTGDPLNGTLLGSDNFFVNGDIRNLIVSGGIGTLAGAPDQFAPNTDFLINGRVQQLKAGVSGFRGAVDIAGRTSELTVGSALTELESTPDKRITDREALAFEGRIDGGQYGGGDPFQLVTDVARNDTFATAQIVGSYYSKTRKRDGQWTLNGVLNNGPNYGDNADYYGIPLLAGQTFQVQLDDLSNTALPTTGSLVDTTAIYLSVIDPQGRVVSTDRSNLNLASFLNQKLQITADKPGVWRIAVQSVSDTLHIDLDRPYQLTVDKVGTMSLGGLVSQGTAYFDRDDVGLRTRTGDLGAILATGPVRGSGAVGSSGRNQTLLNALSAQTANIRSIEGSTLGILQNGLYSNIPNITAPRGSVGLLRTTGFLYFNLDALAPTTGEPVPSATIGGDFQMIDAGADLSANMSANGSIGVIRAGSWGQNIRDFPGFIQIDANGDGGGAQLGLIDVTGDFGSANFGGPTISNGNGNVRYLRVGGDVFRPVGVGAGGLALLTGTNQAQTLLDDSGATVRISPYNGVAVRSTVTAGGSTGGNGVPDPFGGNGTPSSTGSNGIPDPFGTSTNPFDPFNGANNTSTTTTTPDPSDIVGTLSVSGYPVGAGYVIYDVQCTTGIAINVSKRGGGGSGDITTVTTNATDLTGTGGTTAGVSAGIVNPTSALDLTTVKPTQQQTLSTGSGTTLDIIMTGGTVNVFQIGATALATEADANTGGGVSATSLLNFGRILNNTNGEIVNLRAGDVSYLGAQSLGVSRPVAGVKIEGVASATDSRFSGFGSGLFNTRNAIFVDNAINIESRGAIGNIVVADTVQNLIANSDNINDKSVLEGIVAPIVMLNANELSGGIRRIEIGEGLTTSGSGDISLGGIYSSGAIGLITNNNGHGDLRGDIIAGRYLEGIRLTGGGSIINADITQGTNIAGGTTIGTTGRFFRGSEFGANLGFLANPPTSRSQLYGIGDIRTTGNGGVISTLIQGYNMGRITVSSDGFGVLSSAIVSNSGAKMEGISAGGLGIWNTQYTGGSTVGDIVATGNGKLVDVRNLSKSVRPDESGYFDPTGTAPNASTDINLLLGTSRKLTKIEGVTNSGVIQDSRIAAARSINSVKAFEIRGVKTAGARPRDAIYPMQINFANSIGTISASRNINGARITGGNIGTISAGRDMLQVEVENNAAVKMIKAGRNILGSVDIHMTGNGSLQTLSVGRNMNGTMFIPKGIRSIIVGGSIGSAYAQGGIRSGTDINLLRVGGDVSGNAYVRATRTIKMIDIDGDVTANATIRATSFGTQKIDGSITGHIING